MSTVKAIRAVARSNFEQAASDFAENPNADRWVELENAMWSYQRAGWDLKEDEAMGTYWICCPAQPGTVGFCGDSDARPHRAA